MKTGHEKTNLFDRKTEFPKLLRTLQFFSRHVSEGQISKRNQN